MCIGHNRYMQVTPKAIHHVVILRLYIAIRYESRKNVWISIWLNPKCLIQRTFMQGKTDEVCPQRLSPEMRSTFQVKRKSVALNRKGR